MSNPSTTTDAREIPFKADTATGQRPPIISFPSDLAENIIWSHSLLGTSSHPTDSTAGGASDSLLQSAFEFPDGILQETRAATSYALSQAAQMASINTSSTVSERSNKALHEPIISLHYPRQGCHNIIDAMVKLLAHEQGTDIVVLDSLEIALGRSGIFGEAILHAVDGQYNQESVGSCGEGIDNSQTQAIQQVFDHIINVQLTARAGDTEAEAGARIVYMRDFGAILPSAKLFFPYLVEALRRRRTAKFSQCQPEADALLQRTVLILGFAESPNSDTSTATYWDGFNDEKAVRRRFLDFLFEREKPVRRVPLASLDNRRISLKSGELPQLPILTQTFFLQTLANAEDLDSDQIKADFPTALKSIADVGLASAIDIAIFPKYPDSEEFMSKEGTLELMRKRVVQSAWLQACLVQRGGFRLKSPSDSTDPGMSTEEETNLNKLLRRPRANLLTILDRIATLALGISSRHSKPDSQVGIEVTDRAISEACKILSDNWEARHEWLQSIQKARESSENSVEGQEQEGEDEGESKNGKEQEGEDKGESKKGRLDDLISKAKSSNDWVSDETKLLSCIVDPDQIATSFEGVCLPEDTIDPIRTVVSLPLLYPAAFKTGVLGREAINGVLLYGPPGTGKTLLCRALAREGGAQMLQVKPSDILSQFVGESEKLIQNIFRLAYQLAPCIIFIDEIDSLFKTRKGDDRRWERSMLNEFLQAMDGLRSGQKNKDAGVIVVGATNRPYDLDEAVLRRLPTRLMIDLPTEKERLEILKVHLNGETLGEDIDLACIAGDTQRYSGSDLKNLCISAAMESLKEAVGGFSWKQKQAEGNSDSNALSDGRCQTRTIKQAHFDRAMRIVSTSSAHGSHSELYQWHEKFGGKNHKGDRHRISPTAGTGWSGRTDTRYMGNGEPRTYDWKKHAGL